MRWATVSNRPLAQRFSRTRAGTTPEILYARKLKATVFYPALAVILVFVVLAMAMPEKFSTFVESGNEAVVNGLGWCYALLVTGFVAFSIRIAFGRRGEVVLGKPRLPPPGAPRLGDLCGGWSGDRPPSAPQGEARHYPMGA